MSFVANPFVAVLDANVLYPFRVRDVLFTFAEEGLFRAHFTDEILDEWTGSVIANKPHFKESVRQQEAAIRRTFGDGLVTGHLPLIAGLELPDPDDCHVLAAAIRCSAQVIVTENLRDFPVEYLEGFGIEALSADDFLINTYSLFEPLAVRALQAVRSRYKSPPMNRFDFLRDLTKCGLPKLAAAARRDIDFL